VTAISDLVIFTRVARAGNMSAAGREMGLSPAVVSKRISLLEDRLNVRLFQRTTRQLTLTDTGEGYFRRVVAILGMLEEAENFVNRRNERPRGILRITAPTSFSRLHIAPHIPRFLEMYPEIELDLHLTDTFVDIIRDGFDLAIRIGALQDSSLVQRKLASDTRVVCASPQYLERHGEPTSLPDLDRHNCLSAGAQESWRLEGPDGSHQLRLEGNIRCNSADFVREALLAGLGIGLRPIWEIGGDLKSGALRHILPQYHGANALAVHAIYPSRDYMPEKLNVFIEYLATLYGSTPYWEADLSEKVRRMPRRRAGPHKDTPRSDASADR
jgi:DNA-binding transcriptional LysR family regulator